MASAATKLCAGAGGVLGAGATAIGVGTGAGAGAIGAGTGTSGLGDEGITTEGMGGGTGAVWAGADAASECLRAAHAFIDSRIEWNISWLAASVMAWAS